MRKAKAPALYGQEFFATQCQGTLRSARIVTSALLELIGPQSIIDFGCGWGAWLKAFEELGVADIKGIDGDYIDRSRLLFDPSRFQPADLCRAISVDLRYDLALCLEVAEHLPRQRATGLVADLVNAAPVVMFSAAIPRQGGVGHINERWLSYWTDIFARHDYVVVDALRPRLRNERSVEFFYRQNLVLYVHRKSLSGYPALASIAKQQGDAIEEWVYAPLYKSVVEAPIPMGRLIREFQRASLRILRRIAAPLSARSISRPKPAWRRRTRIMAEQRRLPEITDGTSPEGAKR